MAIELFLSGDVMTGRGVDQILPHPVDPELREGYVRDARGYVLLAETVSGRIQRPVSLEYPWGDALSELARARPDARIVNLETSITRSDAFWPNKPVCYRMSPENAACLQVAKLDVCGLANNHAGDFGLRGLVETIETLERLGIAVAGAGRTLAEAEAPAIVDLGARGRVLVFAIGSPSAGVPEEWAATERRPGVWLADERWPETVARVAASVERHKRPGDVVVVSVHWGPNWGYAITRAERRFAHALVGEAGADVVHGHSSHHVKGIEVYQDRLVLYGCGDLLTDYEGIGGFSEYRGGLGLMYFPTLDRAGRLERLEMTPTEVRRLRITRAGRESARWLRDVLAHEGKALGTSAELDGDSRLHLSWRGG